MDLSSLHDDRTPHRHRKGSPMNTQPYKALAAFVLAFVGAMVATLQGRPDLDSMKTIDWIIVIGAAVVTAGTVWTVPNPPKA